MNWEPIETAPKDGSEIILADRYGSYSGFWHDGSQNYWKKEGWYVESDRSNLLTARPLKPKHWMPMPVHPEGE